MIALSYRCRCCLSVTIRCLRSQRRQGYREDWISSRLNRDPLGLLLRLSCSLLNCQINKLLKVFYRISFFYLIKLPSELLPGFRFAIAPNASSPATRLLSFFDCNAPRPPRPRPIPIDLKPP